MEGQQKLDVEAFREKVRRARSMTFEEKLAESSRLTELAFEAMKAEIRADFPQADESEVERVFALRIQLMRIAKGKLPGGRRFTRSTNKRLSDHTGSR